VLIHEATYTEEVLLKVGPAPMHSSALRVARMAQAARLPNLVLTHFSPRYQDGAGPLSMGALEAEARGVYTGSLFLARDFDRYVLGRDGTLAAKYFL
jgi:ribonuclease Z